MNLSKAVSDFKNISDSHPAGEPLEKLYDRLKQPVFLLALSILKDKALAEDALQETFLKIMQNGQSFRSESSIKTWIMTVARNTSLDMLRKRRPETELSDLLPVCGTEYEQVECKNDFLDAVKSFDGTDRSILVFRIFVGLSHSESAKILGITPGNARIRYHRAIKVLKNHYGKEQ